MRYRIRKNSLVDDLYLALPTPSEIEALNDLGRGPKITSADQRTLH